MRSTLLPSGAGLPGSGVCSATGPTDTVPVTFVSVTLAFNLPPSSVLVASASVLPTTPGTLTFDGRRSSQAVMPTTSSTTTTTGTIQSGKEFFTGLGASATSTVTTGPSV